MKKKENIISKLKLKFLKTENEVLTNFKILSNALQHTFILHRTKVWQEKSLAKMQFVIIKSKMLKY